MEVRWICRVATLLTLDIVFVTSRVFIASENAIPAFTPTVVHKWVTIDYERPTNLSYHNFMMTYTYDYRNTILGGMKVYKDEIYVTIPRISPGVSSTLNKVIEKDGVSLLAAFPNWQWQRIGDCNSLQTVNNIEIDPTRGWMWIIDTGRIQTFWGGLRNLCPPKLIIYDLNRDAVVARYEFPPEVAPITDTFLSDIAIDPEALYAFIPNTVLGKLIFFSLNDNYSIAVDHQLFKYEKGNESITIDGRTGTFQPVSANINGIAMSPRRDYIVFSHLGGYGLYRVSTEFFRKLQKNPSHASELGNYIKRVGYKVSQSRGILLGHEHLYYGALGRKSVFRWPISDLLSYPDVSEDTLRGIPQTEVVADDRMYWVDTVTLDEKGVLWISSSNMIRYFLDVMDYHNTFNYFIWKADVSETSYLWKKTARLPPTTTTTVPPSAPATVSLRTGASNSSGAANFADEVNTAGRPQMKSIMLALEVALTTSVILIY